MHTNTNGNHRCCKTDSLVAAMLTNKLAFLSQEHHHRFHGIRLNQDHKRSLFIGFWVMLLNIRIIYRSHGF